MPEFARGELLECHDWSVWCLPYIMVALFCAGFPRSTPELLIFNEALQILGFTAAGQKFATRTELEKSEAIDSLSPLDS